MKRARNCLALALVTLLALGFFPRSLPSYAAESYVITVTEDTLLRDTGDESMAIFQDGLIYVPYTTLQRLNGVGCTYNAEDELVTVFKQGAAIYFELDSGYTYTYGGRPVQISARMRGSVPYVPVQVVCTWLNLYYNYTTANDSGVGYPVIRVAGKTPATSDATILSRNADALREVADERNRLSGLIPDDPITPNPPPVQPPSPPEEPDRDITLLFLGQPDDALSSILDTLEGARYSAAFFFPSREIYGQGEALREVWCRGFCPGILLSGEDLLREATDASQACAGLLHVRVRLVSCTREVSPEERTALEDAGFRLWMPNSDPYQEKMDGQALLDAFQQLLDDGEDGSVLALRPDSMTLEVLPVLSGYLSSMNYTVLDVWEWTEPPVFEPAPEQTD